MYDKILQSAAFHALLIKLDHDELARVRALGCPHCAGPLHAAHFTRKSRGVEGGLGDGPEGFAQRFDLCCGHCRRRTMPRSVRFLGRRVYTGLAVLCTSAKMLALGRDAASLARRELGVSLKTLARWQRWWAELAGTPLWERVRGRVPVGLDVEQLPKSLLDAGVGDAIERVLAALQMLRPWPVSPGHAEEERARA